MNRLPTLVRQHIAAFRALLVFTVLCGIVYPVVMVGVAQLAFRNQANGSLVSYNGHVVGSSLLCQEFVDAKGNPLPQYFQPRASNASSSSVKNDYGCDPEYSGAANLGPDNSTLVTDVKQLQKQIAAFATTYPALNALNIMHLATPASAIMSAVIFNALVIIFLIPLALRGITYRAVGAGALLQRNLLIYGLGGVVVPFLGIKIIDVVLAAFHLT